MYNLYTDKTEKFQCKIGLEGASINNSKVRVILESENINLLFNGTVNSSGLCEVNIGKLKNILSENTTGKIKLEVIADDDVYFCPWSSDFQVVTSRKAVVEVLSSSKESIKESNKPKIQVSGIKEEKTNTTDNEFKDFVNILKEYKVNKNNIIDNKSLLPIITKYKRDINNKDTIAIFINKLKNSF